MSGRPDDLIARLKILTSGSRVSNTQKNTNHEGIWNLKQKFKRVCGLNLQQIQNPHHPEAVPSTSSGFHHPKNRAQDELKEIEEVLKKGRVNDTLSFSLSSFKVY